mmetsp:Transcript_6704/g.21448  ORF Transcript_6704/g.21448 Transcript_6704/m.21448 type:complete len:310 (+) Transcript_6704:1127-2056(+)
MDELVVGALQEGRVDGAEGLDALDGEAGGEGDGVLLGDTHVERPLREALAELVHACAAWHRRGDGHHGPVRSCEVDKRVGEDGGVRGRLGGCGQLLARRDVELWHAVVLVGRRLCGRVALAFVSLYVQQDGLLAAAVADVFEDRDEVIKVVPIDGADVVEAELLEERASRHHAARVLVDLRVGLLDLGREEAVDRLCDVAEVLERLGSDQARRVRRERASRDGSPCRRGTRRERDLAVVVVDDDDPRVEVGGVVHRLIGHAAGDGAVANHGDRGSFLVEASQLVRHRHAQRRRDGGGGVARAKGIVFRL